MENRIITSTLDGILCSAKSSILNILKEYEDTVVVKEPEQLFDHVLEKCPDQCSNIIWSAQALQVQLTVMSALLEEYSEKRKEITEKTKFIILERDLLSSQKVFGEMTKRDPRFHKQTKHILDQISKDWPVSYTHLTLPTKA